MKKNSLTHAGVTAACFCMLVFFFSAAPMRAQSTFGDIIGVVKDPGQGVVPGTQVVLTNTDDRT